MATYMHERIKEFKHLKSENVTSRQKAFALNYTRYIQFLEENVLSKKYPNVPFFNNIVNCFCDGHKVIHHSNITRKFMDTFTIFVTRR